MKITAKETGSGELKVSQLKDILNSLPDNAVMAIVAGQDNTVGHYLIEASWDPSDTVITKFLETPKDPGTSVPDWVDGGSDS